MSEIIAPLLAPEKWYAKFDHVAYARPNFDDALSPLNSVSFEPEAVDKERRARRILRKLLEEQADINEGLADENDILQGNLKALLGLLLAKDRQLENLSTTAASSVMLSAGRPSPRWEPLSRASARLGVSMMRRAWWTWKVKACSESLRSALKSAAVGKLVNSLLVLTRQRKARIWRQLAAPKAILRAIRTVRRCALRTGFAELHCHLHVVEVRRTEAASLLAISLSRLCARAVHSAFRLLSASQSRLFALKSLLRAVKSAKSKTLHRWRSLASHISQQRVREDKQATIAKVTDFSKRFLKLNQLCSIFARRCKTQLARKFLCWRLSRPSVQWSAGIEHIKAVTARTIRRLAWKKLTATKSELLPRLLKSVLKSRILSGFVKLLVNAQSGSDKKAQISKLDSEMEFIQEELLVAVQEKEKAETRLVQAVKKNAELESVKAAVEKELESAKTAARETSAKAERVRVEADREKVAWGHELKKVVEELTTLKAAQSRLEGQYAQCMHEKARLMAQENEQRKQLISMSGTLDRLAEERDFLHEQLENAEQSAAAAKAQLEKTPLLSQKKEAALETRAKELESTLQAAQLTFETKSAQKQKEITSLQQLCQELKSQLDQTQEQSLSLAEKERLRRLTKENAQLSGRLEELQREQTVAKTTNSQLSSQVLKLNKEIADLKIEMNEVKANYGKLQNEYKSKKNELDLLDSDVKRIQAERDRLIAMVREQQKNSQFTSDMQLRTLQEQNRRLQEEVQRLQTSGISEGNIMSLHAENIRLQSVLADTQAELEECRKQAVESREELASLSHELDNYGSVFEAMDRKVVETEASEREAIRARDTALQELALLKQRYFAYLTPA